MTLAQALKILQTNERGRQGILRAQLMKELRDEDLARQRAEREAEAGGTSTTLVDPVAAGTAHLFVSLAFQPPVRFFMDLVG